MDILEDELVKQFLQNRNLSKNSVKVYLNILIIYSDFINMPPSDFILEAEDEEEQRIRMRKRKLPIHLLNFREYLIEKNYSQNTISSYMVSVRSFYSEFYIEIPKMRMKKNLKQEGIEDIPSKDDIRKALKYANPKYTAIIILLSSSGMGASEILSLKYSDFVSSLKDYIKLSKDDLLDIDVLTDLYNKTQEENLLIVPIWKIIRVKTGLSYIAFSSPESVGAILEYLRLDPPTQLNSFLFRNTKKQQKPIQHRAFFKYFVNLNQKAGFGKPDRQIFLRSHAVGRKFFATTLYKKGLPQLSIDWLLAHTIDKVTSAYFKADIESLKKQYITVIPDLSIQDVEIHTFKSPEFIEIQKQLKKQEQINKEKDEQFEKLQKEIEAMRYIKKQ